MSWNPTHVVVAVQRAKDLISKGKNGTNDAFVTIALSSNKFQTSIKDKVIDPEWYEECDVPLPDNYNEHKLTLQVFHRNNLGIDEFLGHLEIPLQNFDAYDAPRSLWYSLVCKPGQNKTKPRGEIEVRLSFEVKKVKDLDSMSTASSASKRFKMRRKVKGPKVEKTADYIPDLTGLDSGALGMDDIAENYAAPVNVSKKRLSNSDSLSLPPASPAFQRGSPRSSRGYSPFNKRHSKGEHDTPPSSNASTEDVKQKADDSVSFDGSFTKTHRRGGSGSDMVHAKPNRRLLTAKKSSSTVDISVAASQEFDVGDRNSAALDDLLGKNRMRTSTSVSQLSNEVLPELEENSKDDFSLSSKRLSSASSKVPDEPVLIDDESDDSLGEYTPSPIVPLVRKDEPGDLFTRMAAQMEQEQADQFNLVTHDAEVGEEVFTPVRKISNPDGGAVHSTPIVEPPKASKPAKLATKHKHKEKKKVAAPASNVFDMLMASDEPEYAVDDTLPGYGKSRQKSKIDDTNPFGEAFCAGDIDDTPNKPADDSKEKHGLEISTALVDNSPVKETPKPGEDTRASGKPHSPAIQLTTADNPFEEPEVAAVTLATPKTSNPFDSPATAATSSSDMPSSSADKPIASVNPFESSDAANLPTSSTRRVKPDHVSTNPFGAETAEDMNPFGEPEPETNSSLGNPFEEEADTSGSNPFEEADDKSASNPFDEEDDEPSSSFQRAGSSRFVSSKRHKKKDKKTAAPPPPKPQRLAPDLQPIDKKTLTVTTPSDSSRDKEAPKQSDSSPADSPRHKSKKDKKAPQAPPASDVGSSTVQSHGSAARLRSSSYNVPSADVGGGFTSKRRSTDVNRVEQPVYKTDSPPLSKPPSGLGKWERQPAIGAEAPDIPTEPKVSRTVGVQVAMDTQETVPSEFRNMGKQDLVDMIQKLRVQVRKKDDHAKDLEEYIDSLLLRVMSTDPNLLSAQAASCSQQANQFNKLR